MHRKGKAPTDPLLLSSSSEEEEEEEKFLSYDTGMCQSASCVVCSTIRKLGGIIFFENKDVGFGGCAESGCNLVGMRSLRAEAAIQ